MAADAPLAARCHFFLLGVAVLLPWNSFITAVDYFGALLPGQHLDRVFSVAYMSVNIVAISLNLRYNANVTAPARVVAGLAGYIVALLAVPIADGLVSAGLLTLGGFKAVLIGALVTASFCDGIVQPAVFGEAAELPLACVQVHPAPAQACRSTLRAHALRALNGGLSALQSICAVRRLRGVGANIFEMHPEL